MRQIDELGRVVIPIEIRRTLGINAKDRVEIRVEGDEVILRKTGCVFCGAPGEPFKERQICQACKTKLAGL